MNKGPDSSYNNQQMKINSRADVVDVRQKVRKICEQKQFSLSETTRVVTATSELARNIVEFSEEGTISWKILEDDGDGIELVFEDEGPGIDDVEWAMQDGNSTGNGLGKGLPGAEKLMDEMQIKTGPEKGTEITVRKWPNHQHS